MTRLIGVLLLALLMPLLASAQTVKIPAWLQFLPKADRTAAAKHVSSLETALGALVKDRSAAEEAEAAYARNARVLAAALDAYGTNPDQFRIGAFLIGKKDLSIAAARAELAFNRRLRWETARDLAENRFGHVEKEGLVSAAVLEERLGRAGRSLSELFAARIAKTAKKNLIPAVTALEDLIAGHPDCPAAAFADLRLRAASLDGAAYRSWCVALAGGSPRSLAADIPADSGTANDAESAYRLARERFVEAYALRGALRTSLPAAAAAGWYVDVYGGADPVPAEAGPAIDSWLRQTALLDPAQLAATLREDPVLAQAMAELVSILWVASMRQEARFAAELGLDAKLLAPALGVVWTAVHTPVPEAATAETSALDVAAPGSVQPVPAIDLAAVLRADRFAEALSRTDGNLALVSAYFDLKGDTAAREAFLQGERYRAARQKLNLALDDWLIGALQAFFVQADRSGEFEHDSDFPGGALVASIALQQTLDDGRTVLIAQAPELARPAFDDAALLLENGTVVLVPPGVVGARLLGPDEQALVGDRLPYLGSALAADNWTNRRLAVLSARYGIPAALAVGAGTVDGDALSRYAVLCSAGFRYAHFMRQER